MNVLHYGRSWDQGGPAVFLSPWWIEEHWGRALEILTLRRGRLRRHASAGEARASCWPGSGPVEISIEELERIDPGDPREIEALRHNVRQLHDESRKAQEAVAWLEGERAMLIEERSETPPSSVLTRGKTRLQLAGVLLEGEVALAEVVGVLLQLSELRPHGLSPPRSQLDVRSLELDELLAELA